MLSNVAKTLEENVKMHREEKIQSHILTTFYKVVIKGPFITKVKSRKINYVFSEIISKNYLTWTMLIFQEKRTLYISLVVFFNLHTAYMYLFLTYNGEEIYRIKMGNGLLG
jgi:hypothetical protein